jgi:hypothetical protein
MHKKDNSEKEKNIKDIEEGEGSRRKNSYWALEFEDCTR